MAQDVVSIDYLLGLPVKTMAVYPINEKDTTLLAIPFTYSGAESEAMMKLETLLAGSKTIVKIDMVYTKFHVSEEFDQMALNRKRFEQLRSYSAEIFDNNVIEWEIIEQVNDRDLAYNKTLFHGFVIHFLDDPYYSGNDGKKTTEEEINFIKEYLKKVRVPISSRVMSEVKRSSNMYLPILKKKREKGKLYNRKFLFFWRKKAPVTYDTIWKEVWSAGSYSPVMNDTVVMKTLRKYSQDWINNIVVQDVTGSMYPYIAQTLAWLRLKMDSTALQHFVFFNDGDSHPDGPIGKSGGAYYIHSSEEEKVQVKIFQVMGQGGGGGCPENNVEATLKAKSEFSEAPAYILIADNNAPVRDLTIMKEIDKPIHLILCGVRNGRVHHSYIQLALSTGGSIHTIEEDVEGVGPLKTGDTFKLGGQTFRFIANGSLILE